MNPLINSSIYHAALHNAQKPHAARAAFAQPTYLFRRHALRMVSTDFARLAIRATVGLELLGVIWFEWHFTTAAFISAQSQCGYEVSFSEFHNPALIDPFKHLDIVIRKRKGTHSPRT